MLAMRTDYFWRRLRSILMLPRQYSTHALLFTAGCTVLDLYRENALEGSVAPIQYHTTKFERLVRRRRPKAVTPSLIY